MPQSIDQSSMLTGCPACHSEKYTKYIQPRLSRSEFIQIFSPDNTDINEVTCPQCGMQWVVERDSDGKTLQLYRLAGKTPEYQGTWFFHEYAPRGEGYGHSIDLTLEVQNNSFIGQIEEASWNEYAREETIKKDIWTVTAHHEDNQVIVEINGGKLYFGYQGYSNLFAIKAVRVFNEYPDRDVAEDKLFVAASSNYLHNNTPFRIWVRKKQLF